MKKSFALALIMLLVSFAFAQNNLQDVLYLKNGSVIRGTILQQDPNVKIETADKNVFVYNYDEIDKITKEKNPIEELNSKRNGYIGITIGPSIPLGDFADKSNGMAKSGLHLTLANYGYVYYKYYGIAASWFGAANPIDIPGYDESWSYGALMVGPLFSYPLSDYLIWDFRPMIGYALTTVPDLGVGTEDASSFAYSVGTVLRVNIGSKVALMLNADYFATKAQFKDFGFEQNVSSFSIGVGIAYRFR